MQKAFKVGAAHDGAGVASQTSPSAAVDRLWKLDAARWLALTLQDGSLEPI